MYNMLIQSPVTHQTEEDSHSTVVMQPDGSSRRAERLHNICVRSSSRLATLSLTFSFRQISSAKCWAGGGGRGFWPPPVMARWLFLPEILVVLECMELSSGQQLRWKIRRPPWSSKWSSFDLKSRKLWLALTPVLVDPWLPFNHWHVHFSLTAPHHAFTFWQGQPLRAQTYCHPSVEGIFTIWHLCCRPVMPVHHHKLYNHSCNT